MVLYIATDESVIYKLISCAQGNQYSNKAVLTEIKNKIINLLYDFCEDCRTVEMASIPPMSFSAHHIRECHEKNGIPKMKGEGTPKPGKFLQKEGMEFAPLQYNNKWMYSIWGLYNRYSPHNVKKNNDVAATFGEMQQTAGSSTKAEFVKQKSAQIENMWGTISILLTY